MKIPIGKQVTGNTELNLEYNAKYACPKCQRPFGLQNDWLLLIEEQCQMS